MKNIFERINLFENVYTCYTYVSKSLYMLIIYYF